MSWAPLEAEPSGTVTSLVVSTTAAGRRSTRAAIFADAGGVTANRIAKWDGTSWSASGRWGERRHRRPGGPRRRRRAGALRGRRLHERGRRAREPHRALGRHELVGRGQRHERGRALALSSHHDGAGSALFAGGTFTVADGVAGEPDRALGRNELAPLGSGTIDTVRRSPATTAGSESRASLIAGRRFHHRAGHVRQRSIASWGCSARPRSRARSARADAAPASACRPAVRRGAACTGEGTRAGALTSARRRERVARPGRVHLDRHVRERGDVRQALL